MIVIGQGLIRKETFEQDLFSIIQQGNGVSEYFLSLSKEVAFAKEERLHLLLNGFSQILTK